MVMANAAASQISMLFGITGPTLTISTACASSAHAIGMAYWMVRQGIASLAVTGGSESAFAYGHLKAWEALRVVAPDTCRPFSKGRKGMVLGEGAAMLVLEPLDTALARGAHIHAEIVGFGMSADASHLTLPNPQGAASAMQAALADAEVQPSDIDYINAHGTGTLANDASEARAIHQVFGPSAVQLAVSSTKSMHGHTLGAAGALEAVATVLALENQFLPPTINHLEADEACELDVIPNIGRTAELGHALSNSFAFGGLNAVLAFRRWENE
jgi:nodulation protein E